MAAAVAVIVNILQQDKEFVLVRAAEGESVTQGTSSSDESFKLLEERNEFGLEMRSCIRKCIRTDIRFQVTSCSKQSAKIRVHIHVAVCT